MLPLLSLSFFHSPSLHACMHGGGRKRGWRGSAYVAACLFVRAPCVGASVGALLSAFLQVGHQLRARRSALLLSEFPGGKSAASALPPPDLVRGEETPRGRRCKSQWTYRKKKNKKTGSHTQSRKHKPIWANTKQKPWLWYKQAAHALEQSRFIDVVVCPLLGWCAERTRIQHELIITSVWSCLKKSRYTPTLHVPVCLCFVSECQTHHCVFSLHCLLYIYIYLQYTNLS